MRRMWGERTERGRTNGERENEVNVAEVSVVERRLHSERERFKRRGS
ncbi:MAG: hypothetical protein ACTS41_02035 [Candidatus Hodgkinia cicadicola]